MKVIRALCLWVICCAALAGAAQPALAQSAADKATARQLATAGIKSYQAANYEDALDKLKRAQALYDAPVHLLYMARAQVKLGKLVEGSESYRKLLRFELDDNSPKVFYEAFEDAEKELPDLEPRIPTLTINIEPASAPNLEIRMDDEVISSAVLGVARPANPGTHQLVATAQGYHPATTSVTLAEGQAQVVSLTLEEDPNAVVEDPTVPGVPTPPGMPGSAETDVSFPNEGLGFVGALRGGAMIPLGALERDRNASDYLGVGGGGEVQLGMRFAKYFGAKFYFETYLVQPGAELQATPPEIVTTEGIKADTTVYTYSVGLLGEVHTERSLFDVQFALELGVALAHSWGWTRAISSAGLAADCELKFRYSAPGLRLGPVIRYPILPNVDLDFATEVTVSQFSGFSSSHDCEPTTSTEPANKPPDPISPVVLPASGVVANQDLHIGLVFAVGAEIVFGNF